MGKKRIIHSLQYNWCRENGGCEEIVPSRHNQRKSYNIYSNSRDFDFDRVLRIRSICDSSDANVNSRLDIASSRKVNSSSLSYTFVRSFVRSWNDRKERNEARTFPFVVYVTLSAQDRVDTKALTCIWPRSTTRNYAQKLNRDWFEPSIKIIIVNPSNRTNHKYVKNSCKCTCICVCVRVFSAHININCHTRVNVWGSQQPQEGFVLSILMRGHNRLDEFVYSRFSHYLGNVLSRRWLKRYQMICVISLR